MAGKKFSSSLAAVSAKTFPGIFERGWDQAVVMFHKEENIRE